MHATVNEDSSHLYKMLSLSLPRIYLLIVKFLDDKKKYRKRRAKISADISARLFRVTCNKVSGILIHKD